MINEYQFNLFRQEYEHYQKAFEAGIQFHSCEDRENQLVHARDTFFSQIGRTQELSAELYESISETFLEWFFFHYRSQKNGLTPHEEFMQSEVCDSDSFEVLERASQMEWSLFELLEIKSSWMRVKNLIVDEERMIYLFNETDNWSRKKGQIIQSRWFPFFGQKFGFLSQSWIHPTAEKSLIHTICRERRDRRLNHNDFMLASFQTMIRTRFLQDQLGASRSQNWLYESLWRKYA